MKTKFLSVIFLAVISFAATFSSCKKKTEEAYKLEGVVQSSISQVVDVFELKYGEVKEFTYEGKTIKFYIEDVEDNRTHPCVGDVDGDVIIPDGGTTVLRIHAFIRIEIEKNVSQLKLSSQRCGPHRFDVQQVWDNLEEWESQHSSMEKPIFFETCFYLSFYEGTLINKTPLSIYIANASPIPWKMNYNIEKSMYEFIFIITNQKRKMK